MWNGIVNNYCALLNIIYFSVRYFLFFHFCQYTLTTEKCKDLNYKGEFITCCREATAKFAHFNRLLDRICYRIGLSDLGESLKEMGFVHYWDMTGSRRKICDLVSHVGRLATNLHRC